MSAHPAEIADSYLDVWGQPRPIDPEVKAALLKALGSSLLKKKKITITTKQTDKSISNLASCTEALIVVVLSFRIETSILLGKVCLILGKI